MIAGGFIGVKREVSDGSKFAQLQREHFLMEEKITKIVGEILGTPLLILSGPKTTTYRTDAYLATQQNRLILAEG